MLSGHDVTALSQGHRGGAEQGSGGGRQRRSADVAGQARLDDSLVKASAISMSAVS